MSITRATPVLRDHAQSERAATPLELFFDLCFVVAVAFLAAELHHGIADNHLADALLAYLLLFVPIWWAWMSYTWFATAFSHDDSVTRLLTFAQMFGVLALAATVSSAFTGELGAFLLAYAGMRTPLVVQWVRSALADPTHRRFAWAYAAGTALAVAMVALAAMLGGPARGVVLVIAVAVELGTPVVAVRQTTDRVFHAGHIAERYGLFSIIVLGETVLAVAYGLRDVVETDTADLTALTLVVGALAVAFALWWLYFDLLTTRALTRHRKAAFAWGYGHYVVFAGTAAVGAALQAELDHAGSDDPARGLGAATLTLAAAAVILTLGLLRRAADRKAPMAAVAIGALALAALAAAVLVLPVELVVLGAALVTSGVVAAGRVTRS